MALTIEEKRKHSCESSRKYRFANREKIRQWARRYYLKHRDEQIARAIKWRHDHPVRYYKYRSQYSKRRRWNDPEYRKREHLYHQRSYRRHRAWHVMYQAKVSGTLKHRARNRLNYAVQSGRLQRPTICDNCRKPCKPDAHHYRGYAYPLSVIWLCRLCHAYCHSKH